MAEPDNRDSLNPFPSAAAKVPLAELKNGKVIFKQKPISFEKSSEAMQETVKFREMIEQRINRQDPPLTVIPDEYRSLIVKLAQESDKGVISLAKYIRSELLPPFDDDNNCRRESILAALPLLVVEHAIQSLMLRTNYGLDGPSGFKTPSTLCIWRWEVRDAYREWLPSSAKEKADARISERLQAKLDLQTFFETLSQEERDAILDPKGTRKLSTKDINQPNPPNHSTIEQTDATVADPELNDPLSLHELSSSANGFENIGSDNVTPQVQQTRIADLDKFVKAKEKEEKRVAKAEREKKLKETQDKSRSLMAHFFGKAKAPPRESPLKGRNPMCGTSHSESDFQKTFKPFVLKKDAEMAPMNWFNTPSRKQSSGSSHADAIVIDGDQLSTEVVDVSIVNPTRLNFSETNAHGRLQDIVKSLRPVQLAHPGSRSKCFFKCFSPCNAKDVFSQLNDAEIAGDTSQVRHFLNILQDRKKLPAKVFIFHEDARPGYYGSWTRNSRIIGPRSPFVRDLLARDYGYDSGEEWEDEGAVDADDVNDDEDEEGEGEEVDSDLDSWLVDDDEVDNVPEEQDLSPSPLERPLPPPKMKATSPTKRKTEVIHKQPEKKRKVVLPLVPYTKGPLWETIIGHCEYDPFKPYRIQLFNDTPYPVDPFAFIPGTAREKQQYKFAKPSLPDRLSGNNGDAETATAAANNPASKQSAIAPMPKTTFPDAHIPLLIDKITNLATTNLTFIVESVYQDLRTYKVKKNAIEAKIREVAEKSKEKKIWVISKGRLKL